MSYLMGLGAFTVPWATDENAEAMRCLNRANDTPQVKAIEGVISNLNLNWHPTGFYKSEDIENVLAMFEVEAANVGNALKTAPLSTSSSETDKKLAFNELILRYLDPSKVYAKAAATAKASGGVVNAPGFKRWVLASMQSIANGYVTATVLHCRQTWIEKWLDRAYKVIVAIGEVVWRIVGVVIKVGEAVVDAAVATAGIAAKIIKYAPYVGAAIVAYVGYTWVRKAAAEGPGATYARISKAGSAAKQRAAALLKRG